MHGQCRKRTRAKKSCDRLHFAPGCATESSAFFWPHHARMPLLPSPVAMTRSSCATENSQPVKTDTFGLYCGVWVVDWPPRQGYKVSVIMATCERWYRALGVLS